jgi:hypothetical protein
MELDFENGFDSQELEKEQDKLMAEQKALLIKSMRIVKEHLGMLGVRSVKMLIQNLKEDCMSIWCDGFKENLKSNFWRKPTLNPNGYETPLIVYEVSESQYEDSFSGTLWIKVKNDFYLSFDFSG